MTVALREALRSSGGYARLQLRTHLDEDELVRIRPDFVWFADRRPRIVADAKYKAEKPSGFPQADLYQLFVYATVLGLPVGHLVYAKGNESERRYVVRRSGVEIRAHALDLDVEPAALLASIGELAQLMLSPGVVMT